MSTPAVVVLTGASLIAAYAILRYCFSGDPLELSDTAKTRFKQMGSADLPEPKGKRESRRVLDGPTSNYTDGVRR
jgi:hypothetical protein